jgi:hypothetical protein
MTERSVRFRDASGKVIATARVSDEGDHWGGAIDLTATPARLRAIFDEFEEIVNGQMFSFLDEIQAKVRALGLTAEFEDNFTAPANDLQVFPSTGEVSFKLATIPAIDRPR